MAKNQTPKSFLQRLLSSDAPDPDDIKAKYANIISHLDNMREEIMVMRRSFIDGGEITYKQLASYDISQPGDVGFPTGHKCVSFRLAFPFPGLCFLVDMLPGAFYGLHSHPDADETVVVLSGTADAQGEEMHAMDVVEFAGGVEHDFTTQHGCRIIVFFTPAHVTT